jgi:hypothetical protein
MYVCYVCMYVMYVCINLVQIYSISKQVSSLMSITEYDTCWKAEAAACCGIRNKYNDLSAVTV